MTEMKAVFGQEAIDKAALRAMQDAGIDLDSVSGYKIFQSYDGTFVIKPNQK